MSEPRDINAEVATYLLAARYSTSWDSFGTALGVAQNVIARRGERHFGDCTGIPETCVRCVADEWMAKAREFMVAEKCAASLDPCPRCPEKDAEAERLRAALAALARPVSDVYALRAVFSSYLRIRARHVHESIGFLPGVLSKDLQERALDQLAADVDHSWLLERLLRGVEPVPFAEWKATQ